MPRVSTYSNFDIPDGEEQTMPWRFWTEEERSLVIRNSYKDCALTSKQVKPYLDASRIHFYTQWVVPIAAAALCFGPFRTTVLANCYKKHPNIGLRNSAALWGGFTIFWLNLSPFYINKENSQEETLKTLFGKIGYTMKMYNDMVSRKTTSTNLDKDTWEIYAGRNCSATGVQFPEEDQAPPILNITPDMKNIKKKYL